ncbi:hypothetical protein F5B19DRAFT_176432 [Rostrohypoxylon terebratum]|nr:hypothetical protein F5B19DRAFT_176432 [Rostrohypoxylon terebratum]
MQTFDDNESVSEDPAILGQKPLPERIRILSGVLHAVIDQASEGDVSYPPHESIVMVRPYKALSFYQNQLREWYNKLDSKFSPKIYTEDDIAEHVDVLSNTSKSSPSNPKVISRNVDNVAMSLPAFVHLRCLLQFIDETIVKKQKNLMEHCRRVSFVDLWHLFKPGGEVIERGDEYMQCYRIIGVQSPRHKVIPRHIYPDYRSDVKGGASVSLKCVYIDFDGSVLGPVLKQFDIPRYNGLKDITSLPVYPISHVRNSTPIRQVLIDRGDKFLKVLHVGHMYCNGLALETRDEVDSQVVVDFTEAFTHSKDHKSADWKPKIESRADFMRESDKDSNDGSSVDDDEDGNISDDEDCPAGCCMGEVVYDDNFVDDKQAKQFLSSLFDDNFYEEDEEEEPTSLGIAAWTLRQDKVKFISDDDKVIMTHRVFGFVLRSRNWAKLNVEDLMDPQEYRRQQEKETSTDQNGNAFDNLVFPNDGLDRKTIVRSLVAQHFRDKESGFTNDEPSDIIRGKGKGLIILLHGAPGVGKTTTAEGIAELFNKPLFQITCGDLGTSAREVETALETNFALANKWGSILLLDEADVFLARRTPQDFKRNGLVAVFLRVLEYYAGILFLTTNRIGDFDEAFSSRIHISLHYPALDYNSTIEIFELNWRLMRARFAHKNRNLNIDTGKITGFIADYWHSQKDARWNGRQIRNACQTALALAEFEAHGASNNSSEGPNAVVHLGVSHIETVANAYLEFIKYLQDVRDIDQERYGWLMGIRRREGRGVVPEDPLAYNPSAPFRSSYTSSLAEQRARLA